MRPLFAHCLAKASRKDWFKRQSSSGDHFILKFTAKGSFYVQQIRRYLGLFSARNA